MIKTNLSPLQMAALWQKIRDYGFEKLVHLSLLDRFELSTDMDQPYLHALAVRLAAANEWDKQYAERVVNEYKKFVFLATMHNGIMPSSVIDKVWEWHSQQGSSYEEFCYLVLDYNLQRPIPDVTAQTNSQTLQLYKSHFGVDAPIDIWLQEADTFVENVEVVTTDDGVIPTLVSIWTDAGDGNKLHLEDQNPGFGGFGGGSSGGGGASASFEVDDVANQNVEKNEPYVFVATELDNPDEMAVPEGEAVSTYDAKADAVEENVVATNEEENGGGTNNDDDDDKRDDDDDKEDNNDDGGSNDNDD